jgi:hypothetical protein
VPVFVCVIQAVKQSHSLSLLATAFFLSKTLDYSVRSVVYAMVYQVRPVGREGTRTNSAALLPESYLWKCSNSLLAFRLCCANHTSHWTLSRDTSGRRLSACSALALASLVCLWSCPR